MGGRAVAGRIEPLARPGNGCVDRITVAQCRYGNDTIDPHVTGAWGRNTLSRAVGRHAMRFRRLLERRNPPEWFVGGIVCGALAYLQIRDNALPWVYRVGYPLAVYREYNASMFPFWAAALVDLAFAIILVSSAVHMVRRCRWRHLRFGLVTFFAVVSTVALCVFMFDGRLWAMDLFQLPERLSVGIMFAAYVASWVTAIDVAQFMWRVRLRRLPQER